MLKPYPNILSANALCYSIIILRTDDKGCLLRVTKKYGNLIILIYVHVLVLALWVMAAKFELEELNDISAARVVIQQGLRANSNSKHLWLEVSSLISMQIATENNITSV